MANGNPMQANLGLHPSIDPSTGQMMTPSPAQTASALSRQAFDNLVAANQQMQSAMQFMQANPSINVIARQVQGQLTSIQSSMTAFGGGAGMGMYPFQQATSPLVTTPQAGQTGQFQQPGQMAPVVPPAPPPPLMQTPFTPRAPAPMFRPAWEQEQEQREMRADRLYSYAAQAPQLAGQGLAYGAAAMVGARAMGGMGPAGRLLGAAGGMAAAHFGGVAQGVGGMLAAPFAPMQREMEMGASIQRMSRGWVLGGPDAGPGGVGLGRGPSRQLAQQVSDLAGNQQFQQQTGGMFNRQDLMQIMSQAGQAGLMDQSQDINAIRQNLRQTARTIREFMELTNDPDVSNVIRTMGQLRDVGMDQVQMRGAAQNLRMYARSAGMSMADISGAGMGGARTFQAAGLAPDIGFGHGMQAVASARQTVAAGAFGPRQLAMMGGVGGIAGREMQAQAAFLGTPALAMAAGQFTPTSGWQMRPGAIQEMLQTPGGMGAQALAERARGSMRAGFQAGGGQALAMWPLQQRMVAAQVAEQLTPEQTTMMRFQMAQATGQEMGLGRGPGAFSLGARRLFGEDIATQMAHQAGSPGFWRMQRAGIEQQQRELGARQYEELQSQRPGAVGLMGREFARQYGGVLPEGLTELPGRISGAARRHVGRLQRGFENIGNWFEDIGAAGRGEVIRRRPRELTMQTAEQEEIRRQGLPGVFQALEGSAYQVGRQGRSQEPIDMAGRTVYQMMRREAEASGQAGGWELGEAFGEVGATALDFTPVGWAAMGIEALTGFDVGAGIQAGIETISGNLMEAQMDASDKRKMLKRQEREARGMMNIYKQSGERNIPKGGAAKALGISEATYETFTGLGTTALSRILKEKSRLGGQRAVTERDFKTALKATLRANVGEEGATKLIQRLEESGELKNVYAQMARNVRAQGGEPAAVLQESELKTERLLEGVETEFEREQAATIKAQQQFMGREIFGEGFEDYGEEIMEVARATAPAEFAAMAALEAGRPGEAQQIFEQLAPTEELRGVGFSEWIGRVRERMGGLSERQREGIRQLRQGQTRQARAFGAMAHFAPLQADIQKALVKHADFTREEAAKIDISKPSEAIAAIESQLRKKFTPEDFERMRKEGGEGWVFSALMSDVGKARKRQEGALTEGQRETFMQTLAAMGEERPEEVKGPRPTGPEAEKLEASRKAVATTQAQFSGLMDKFSAAAGQFNQAAPIFLEAAQKLNKHEPIAQGSTGKPPAE